ncbi:SprT family zinc-dependent metalloprotease [Shimia sp. R9_3]|uniref:M48 family metallopeptidase n=1 Tax=Shimia sp. R9_3 TaxID=2821113 RepID=UPI001AD963E4|nr:SprT family zinc-dependent metalloprotease [Shimia sp. R9_3]MBO9399749.1 M48 family metallopeptidase [Shimia sp. R9_3]
MTQHIIPGTPPVTVALRQSSRARRISLRVSRLDGKVTLTVPRGVSTREALGFAEEKQDWLRRQLSQQPEQVLVAPGAVLPVAGRDRLVVAGQGRSVVLGQDELAVPGRADLAGRKVQGFLKELARHRLSEAVDHYAAHLRLPYSRMTLRDTRSRWGSCSSAGALMFSWRLVMAAPDVLDYVAAHEVAHLKEMNHSQAFWSVVTQLYGPYEVPRRWLRTDGQVLHRYRFDGV